MDETPCSQLSSISHTRIVQLSVQLHDKESKSAKRRTEQFEMVIMKRCTAPTEQRISESTGEKHSLRSH